MENSKDKKPQYDLKHNGEEKMNSGMQEHWFSEDELSPAEDDGSSADTSHTEVFNRLYADLGLPSGTVWARDNLDASPFYYNLGESVDYLHLTVSDDCIRDKVLHLEAPSADQMAELLQYTKHEFRKDGSYTYWKLTSEINGEEILLPVGVEYVDAEGHRVRETVAPYYWTSTEDENDGHCALALEVGNTDGLDIVSLDINTKAYLRPVIKK